FQMIFLGFLGLFIAPGLASYNINVNDDDNVARSGQQRVSINNAHNVANIDNNNGWNSWNSIWDYENSFAATRLFAKKSCIVHRMNKEVMPSIETFDALVKEKKLQGKGPGGPPPKTMTFSINPNQVDDLSQFGANIAGMCQGMPTYIAEEIPGIIPPLESKKCYSANILWVLNISFCRTTEEQF
ncbi:gastrokine-1-like, partial [Perognathus longimembris pacificus]|uniref:gastrokine-1-like n=1 Tax=Perognathus longimembris pacificus TaxID=214514 RepID=UPI002018CFAD